MKKTSGHKGRDRGAANSEGHSKRRPRVAVICENPDLVDEAETLAHDLDLPFATRGAENPTTTTGAASASTSGSTLGMADFDYLLVVTSEHLELRSTDQGGPGAVYVDFTSGTLDFRRRYGQKGGEAVIKAIGGSGQKVFDATAGLGSDTYVLASYDCEVTAVEREPVIAALVMDALRRGRADRRIENVCERIHLRLGDAFQILQSTKVGDFDVVYLDPMFPEKKKKALPKKELRVLQEFAGGPEDEKESQALLKLACKMARRVVVKRPAKAPPLAPGLSHSVKQASVRFDVYL